MTNYLHTLIFGHTTPIAIVIKKKLKQQTKTIFPKHQEIQKQLNNRPKIFFFILKIIFKSHQLFIFKLQQVTRCYYFISVLVMYLIQKEDKIKINQMFHLSVLPLCFFTATLNINYSVTFKAITLF